MSLSVLFLLGYVLAMFGAAFIVAVPIKRVMGFDSDPSHANPEDHADAQLVLFAVIVGVAAVWPVSIGLYYASRFIPASAEVE